MRDLNAAVGVFVVVGACTFLLVRRDAASFQQDLATVAKRAKATTPTIDLNNEYGALASAEFFKWEHLVEPHIATTLSVNRAFFTSEDAKRYISCDWSVTSADGEEHFERSGCSGATVQFTRAPHLYLVDLKLTAQDLSLGTHRFEAMCKYVRREIRALTREDRRRYFSALEQVHRLDLADGRAMYGDRFVNYRHFTAKHLDATTPNDCFPYVGPYHGANSFLTSHGAFTLELEQALQSVDARVTQPYWDFTIDTGALGVNWLSSQMFDDDWFAPGSTAHRDHIAGNGSTYFSHLPVPDAGDFVVRNSYGRLTHPVNQDSVSFVTRGDSICGLPTKSKLAGKDEILGCMAIQSLGEWRACLEVEVHAYAHTMIGGVWDCPFSFETFLTGTHPDDKLAVGRAEFLALNSINLWKIAQAQGLLSCPSACSDDTPFSDCMCSCKALETYNDSAKSTALAFDDVYSLLDQSRVIDFLKDPLLASRFVELAPSNDVESEGKTRFVGLSAEENEQMMRAVLDFTCHPGKLGVMSTDASPNDPIFWPLHLLYDRAWHQVRVDPDFSQFNHTWKFDADSCPGYALDDVMPFEGFQGDRKAPVAKYTNRELYDYFDPSNEDLPYIYDSFAFGDSPLRV